jgi:phosphoglycolate phosphatase
MGIIMKTKGIIFDLDGTLVDSLADIGESMNFVLSRHGLPVHEIMKYGSFVGNGLDLTVARAIPVEFQNDNFVSELLKDSVSTRPLSHKPGTIRIISCWRPVGKDIPPARSFNKSDDFTRYIVHNLFPGNRFSNISGSGDDRPKKPDPTETLRILRSWKIIAEEGLFVGDLPVDMETARRAGMRPLGVKWGFQGIEGLRKENVRILSRSPAELI